MDYKRRMRILLLLISLTLLLYATPVHANPTPGPSPDFGPGPAGLTEIESMVGNVVSLIVGLAFVAMMVLILMAGFKYLISGGEPKALQSAHHTLVWALIGIGFIAMAWLLLLILSAFTGINLTIFNIKALCINPSDIANPFCP